MAVAQKNKEEWYIKTRLEDQIEWYGSKSTNYKKKYNALVIADIVLSAFIPCAALFITSFSVAKYVIAIMGSVVAIISGFLSTFQFQKKWIEYRTTSETLKHEKYLFEMDLEPYDTYDKISILVRNVESLISKENTNWAFYIQKHNNKSNKKSKRKGDNHE